jgi:redox-sensing transcriptional repressor
MSSLRKVSDSTVRRLSLYLRILRQIRARGETTISSEQLADEGGLTSAQVRKDLSFFGNFGVRGRGYDVVALEQAVQSILGLDRVWPAVVVGAGRLGSALTAYPDFARQGFRILALFDTDPAKHGRRFGDAEVLPLSELESFARRERVSIGIVATPAAAAQDVANQLIGAGILGILNFAPARIEVPPHVSLRQVNLAVELEGLSFAIVGAGQRANGGTR